MFESIITMSVTGLLAGFIFAMPIAGPISILIFSNALKGRLRYCQLVSLGGSIADFTYVFIAVFGLTRLYSFYAPAVPYMFAGGSLFFFFIGYKIFSTHIDIENLEDKSHLTGKIEKKERGGFYAGLMINFLNPTLFIGSLTSSFFVISLIASIGLHTGGLAIKIDENVSVISKVQTGHTDDTLAFSHQQIDMLQIPKMRDHKPEPTVYPKYFHLAISICYAFFLSLGTILWFLILSYLISRFRYQMNIKLIGGIIKSLGVLLCIIGLYFAYSALRKFL